MAQKPENETSVQLNDARESFIGRAQEDDVNRLYLQALVAQRMPDSVASNLMLTESMERKRLFLVMHKKMMDSESAKRFEWNQADELRLNLMLDAVVNRSRRALYCQQLLGVSEAWKLVAILHDTLGHRFSSLIGDLSQTAE